MEMMAEDGRVTIKLYRTLPERRRIVERLTEIGGRLLEGCIWDERRCCLYFVDIEKFRIYCWKEGEELACLPMHTYVSAIVLREDGTLAAALQDGLYQVDFEKRTYSKRMDSGFPANIRYNDGKCDQYGDFWAGSMYVDQNEAGAKEGGSLFCIRDGAVAARYPSYTIPNGLDWKDGYFFHTETSEKKISVYCQEESVRGDIGKKVSEIDLSEEMGAPDGMCIDRDGNLWIAMWGGAQVIGYDPEKKEIFERIPVPAKNVSCCILGGKEGNRLFITTAEDEYSKGEVYTTLLTNHYGKAGYRYGGR